MKNRITLIVLFVIAIIAAGCMSRYQSATSLHGQKGTLQPGSSYTIVKGDTLFGIAWRYGLDMDELATWNGIRNKNKIFVGQRLRTTPPSGVTRKKIVTPQVTTKGLSAWVWPTQGQVVSGFSSTVPGKQGIKIKANRGQAVNASSAGEVAYTGSGLSGFGRMIIIRHSGNILTAYGYLDGVNVREGQKVVKGQKIGSVGIGPTQESMLYFETRKQGQPVNPYGYIGSSPRK